MSDKTAAEDQIEHDGDDLSEEAEKAALKQRAKLMNLKVSNNIGLEALREKVNAAIAGDKSNDETEKSGESGDEETKPAPRLTRIQRRKKLRDEKMKLVRVRITNMNPQKKDIPGEYFSFGNEILGTHRRYVPYNEAAENGWHVEQVILDMMRERKFNSITTKPNKARPGEIEVKTKWVPEFAIEVLPPLTEKELKELGRQQAAARGIDNDE